MAKKKDSSVLYCSFCGRSDREVELMLPGMNGCICNECAERAVELSHEYLNKIQKARLTDLDMDSLPKPEEIKAYLDQYVIGKETAKSGVKSNELRSSIEMFWVAICKTAHFRPLFSLSVRWSS